MHLLYLDDSGSVENKNEEYVILGGISVHESTAHYVTNKMDSLAESIDPSNPDEVEFHASEIFARRTHPWNGLNKDDARGILKSVLKIFADTYDSAKAFACAVHKPSFTGKDPMETSFEELCNRFDIYLSRLKADGEIHKGIIILDESTYETTLQKLAISFRHRGTRWRNIRNLADIPFFVDSKACRLVQMADHVAYAVFRRYNAGDAAYFDIISPKFDHSEGIIHGLVHKYYDKHECMCPACLSRKMAECREESR